MEHFVEKRILKVELPTPFPVGNINAYYVHGTEPVLIDTGLFYPPSLEKLKTTLLQHGHDLKNVRRILLTHDHLDHSGASLFLSQECGAVLHVHQKSKILNRHHPDMWEAMLRFLRRCSVPDSFVIGAHQTFRESASMENRAAKPAAIEWLRGGEVMNVDDLSLHVISTPGHSPDHLCFHEPHSGVIFCGDTLIQHITPNPTLNLDPDQGYRRHPSLLLYMDSLHRIESLHVSTGYSGHGKDIADVRGHIRGTMTFIRERENLFLSKIRAGAKTVFPLALAVFGRLDGGKYGALDQFLSISETIAYLDLLERDGFITVGWDESTIEIHLRD